MAATACPVAVALVAIGVTVDCHCRCYCYCDCCVVSMFSLRWLSVTLTAATTIIDTDTVSVGVIDCSVCVWMGLQFHLSLMKS